MPKIFISYRRDDSAAQAGRLYDRLEGHFGQGQVFMDVDTIRPGVNFVEIVQQAIGACDGLVAVIGSDWLQISDATGMRRLDDPADLVRLEIATALERGIPVIPVLVQGARMPHESQLPVGLTELAYRNAVEVSDARFRSDVEPLIEALEAPTEDRLADTVFVEPVRTAGSTFVGRERELAELRTALDDAVAGRGRLVMLAGEPGIGKTRTTQELASLAETKGAQVLWGWCYEEASLPYLPFVEALRAYVLTLEPEDLRQVLGSGASDVARIVSEVGDRLKVELRAPGDPEEDRYRLLQAVNDFLINATHTQPLMLVLEDLHDADRGTLDLLTHVARNLAGARLLIVGTYRDVEVNRAHPFSGALANLRRVPSFSRVPFEGPEYWRGTTDGGGQRRTGDPFGIG